MKKLNERFGAKLDDVNLSVGAGDGEMNLEYVGNQDKLPYYVLQGDKNACKFVTFCDKIGGTMRDVSCGLRGAMSDKTKGKSKENGSIFEDLCGADENKNISANNKNKNRISGKLAVRKCGFENAGSGQTAEDGGSVTENCKTAIKSGLAIKNVLSESGQIKRAGLDKAGVRLSEESGKFTGGSEILSGSENAGSGQTAEDGGSVTENAKRCVNLSDAEVQDIRLLAKRRVEEMRKMEEDVHPVFVRGAVDVLSDKDKLRLDGEYVKFGLRRRETEAGDRTRQSVGAGMESQARSVEASKGSLAEESVFGEDNNCPIGFGDNRQARVSYNLQKYNNDDEFSYENSSLKSLDGYEQVSKCILCSPNTAYGEATESEYEKNDLVSYGRLVFDARESADKNLGDDKVNKGLVQNENLGASGELKRKKGRSKAYIVGAGDVNDCFPAGKIDLLDRKMVLNASVIGLDEEFIPMEVKNCELLNMRLDKRDVKLWGEKEWAKFFIKVDPCLNMCIDYCDRLVEKMVMLGGYPTESMAYGSAENMFNDMIDLIERKKMYLRLKKFVDRLKKELDAVDEKIIAYFVFGENTKDELLQVMSRRTVYRRASKIIKKLADFCVARGYTASWLYEKFGMVV